MIKLGKVINLIIDGRKYLLDRDMDSSQLSWPICILSLKWCGYVTMDTSGSYSYFQYDCNALQDLKNDWIRLQNPATLSSKSSKLPCLMNFQAQNIGK